MLLGALSFDATQSRARLPYNGETLGGGSYRLSYSKSFDELDSQVTFAGYRFSEQNFMSMSEYLMRASTAGVSVTVKRCTPLPITNSCGTWGERLSQLQPSDLLG